MLRRAGRLRYLWPSDVHARYCGGESSLRSATVATIFEQVRVNPETQTVEWPGEVDLDPDVLDGRHEPASEVRIKTSDGPRAQLGRAPVARYLAGGQFSPSSVYKGRRAEKSPTDQKGPGGRSRPCGPL
jgi:hypothetical protein